MHVEKLILLVLLMSPGVTGAAEVYKSVDEDGNVVFTDEPPDGVDSEPVHLEPYGPPVPR